MVEAVWLAECLRVLATRFKKCLCIAKWLKLQLHQFKFYKGVGGLSHTTDLMITVVNHATSSGISDMTTG